MNKFGYSEKEFEVIWDKVRHGKAMNFMDALILDVAEEHYCSKFVTWDE